MTPMVLYPGDLSGHDWSILEPLIPSPGRVGIRTGGRALLVGLGTTQEYDPGAIVAAVRSCSSSDRAPEQYGIDVQTDIYGLGTVFYTLITGIVPTDALPVWRTWTRSKL